jgi:hypothetical protein
MSDFFPEQTRKAVRPPSAIISRLDSEIRQRFAKRTDSLPSFLMQWIKLDESQKLLFDARGMAGETYLQYELMVGDVTMALAIAQMCVEFAESISAERTIQYLNHIDNEGNDVWHYLAENLASNEDEDGLSIAKILIQLDIDYCRKNDKEESPLARLLIPEVKWQSINSVLLAKSLSVAEMEESFASNINQNEPLKAEIMVGIFVSDLQKNRGVLLSYLLQDALSPRAEKADRAAVARALFEYVGGNRSETVLMRTIETEHKDLFERMMQLMLVCAEEAYAEMAASDAQLAKAHHQVYMYRRLGRRNRVFQSLLHKAVQYDRPSYITAILGALRNEDLAVLKRNSKGGTERELLLVDKNSPAPYNPGLSLLLSQDARGNLPIHTAVIGGRDDCLRKLLFGLSLTDAYALLNRVPNRQNLTILDLISVKHAHVKLTAEIKAQRITVADAQSILQTIKDGDKRIQEFLMEALRKAEDVIARNGGKATKPSFDLARIPTIQIALRNSAPVRPGEVNSSPPPSN